MAVIGNKNPTLIDVANLMEDGKIAKTVVELLKQSNAVIDDMTFLEANDGSGHKTTMRTGLPAVAWRMLNYGVPNSKSGTAQVRDGAGMLEAYAEVDKSLAQMSGDVNGFRMQEDQGFIESMSQVFQSTLFYGNTAVNPERFLGLAPRFSSLSAPNADNIINAGGVGSDNTSIWLIGWSPRTVHGIYPRGSQAGVQHQDLGEQTLKDAAGGQYQGYRTHYKWDSGLVVRDWRYVVRIANIDVSDMTKNAATGADLVDLMTQALELVPENENGVRWTFYANRKVRSFLRRQIKNNQNMNLDLETIAGKKVVTFDGIPVRQTDQILNTEAAVV